MRIRSSPILPVVSPSNPSTSNPKHRSRRHSKQPFILEEYPIDTMADQCTMAEFLRIPTEGYAKAIMVLPILAERFELKHRLINIMTMDQFFRLEKENPHDHILIVEPLRIEFPFLEEQFEEDPPKDPPEVQMTDNHTMAEMLRAPTEGYAEAIIVPLILAEQFELKHSLINMITSEQIFRLKKDNPHDHIRCSEMAKLTHAVNEQTSAATTAMTAMLRQFQATQPPAPVKAVEETLLIFCLATGGNTFLEIRDNIQGYVSAVAVNYKQGNYGYRPPGSAHR
nr:reverse transcriptase domain-containing protein [Tanacetum cinerariifolium]